MKNTLIIAIILVSNALFAQDYRLFIDINTYRQANGLNKIVFDENSHIAIKEAVNNNNTPRYIESDTTYWGSDEPSDSTNFVLFLKANNINTNDFIIFIQNYYKTTLKIIKKSDVEKYILYYVVFDIDRNEGMKKDVLDDGITRGSIHVIINNNFVSYGYQFN